ncbi:MAG: hypothetical protein ACOZDD_10815 [Bacteroidota bacterium]
MENGNWRYAIHAFLMAIGLGLIIGGIITGTSGAVVIGIIVSGINAQQWVWWNRKRQSD